MRAAGGHAADAGTLLDAVRLLRTGGRALATHVALHGRLARIEWQEEQRYLLLLVLNAVAGFACLLSLMLFAGVAVLAATWESDHRPAVAAGLALLSGAGVLAARSRVRVLAGRVHRAFEASRQELAADAALIKENA